MRIELRPNAILIARNGRRHWYHHTDRNLMRVLRIIQSRPARVEYRDHSLVSFLLNSKGR